jgi:hypothetical protein
LAWFSGHATLNAMLLKSSTNKKMGGFLKRLFFWSQEFVSFSLLFLSKKENCTAHFAAALSSICSDAKKERNRRNCFGTSQQKIKNFLVLRKIFKKQAKQAVFFPYLF